MTTTILDAAGQPYRQDPPNCIELEATEGCTLACQFCGIRGIREKPNSTFKFLTIQTADRVGRLLADAGWAPRIEFTMRGEPCQNPDLPEIVATMRRHVPDCNITVFTNGMPLVRGGWFGTFEDSVDALFAAGCDTLALDNYAGMRAHEFARAMDHGPGSSRPWLRVGDYPADTEFSPHHKRGKRGAHRISIVEDIMVAVTGSHAHLSNHGGASGPKDYSFAGKRCAMPFRDLAIRFDGNVPLCCNDWRGAFKVGNVHDSTLEELWHSPTMYAARKKLYRGERTFGPCDGCSHRSFRVGLLPDKLGKADLPEADAADMDLIDAALEGDPYTLPVLRTWERREGKPQPGVLDGKPVLIDADGNAVVRERVSA